VIPITVYDIDHYRVGEYDVDLTPDAVEPCHCADHQYRQRQCKHYRRAVEIRQQLNAALDALPEPRE
jgi:hypothetical protein